MRVIIGALLVGFVVAGMGDGWWSSPSAEPTVQSFLLDWQEHNYAAAAELTTGEPAAVADALETAYRGVAAASFSLSMWHIQQAGKTATAYFYASVDLGQNGASWSYRGRFTLHLTSAGWKIDWSPSVINPALGPHMQLAVVSALRRRQPLLDAAGNPLQTLSPTVVAGVYPGRLHDLAATAAALGAATNIETSEIQGWIQAAPRKGFFELLTLTPSQYHYRAKALGKVPGLVIHHTRMRLFASTAPAVVGEVGTEISPIFRNQGIAYRPGATLGVGGLQQHYQDYLAGSPTTEVVTETETGHQVKILKTWNGRRPAAVHTTIVSSVQSAATRAVNTSRGSAAIVVMQASNGHILAVASNKRRGLPAIDPLNGHYPPGGAFTIISTEALLASGLQQDTPEPCLPSNNFGGKNFRNVPAVPDLGKDATFALDFAHSCGTAFGALSQRPGMREHLADAARGFGLGTPWQLPLKSFSGQVGDPGGVAQLAAASMGESPVQVSPLTMAAVAAQVDTGVWHQPALVTKPDPQRTQQVRFSATTMNGLRSLMRKAVQSGAARDADVTGRPVYGQVGTTSLGGHGRHQRWAAWFVGYRGDTAFAAVVFGASPHISAVRLAAAFLRDAPGR